MSEKLTGFLLKSNGLQVRVEFPDNDKLYWYYRTIGCDYVTIVEPYGIEKIAKQYGLESLIGKYCLIADDEALLKDKPEVNMLASLLYGYDFHGEMLCGNVIVAKNNYTEDGIETVGLNQQDGDMLIAAINALIAVHNEKVAAG